MVTQLGHQVKDMNIKSLEKFYLFFLTILEIDYLIFPGSIP